jgi:hypothetical protein
MSGHKRRSRASSPSSNPAVFILRLAISILTGLVLIRLLVWLLRRIKTLFKPPAAPEVELAVPEEAAPPPLVEAPPPVVILPPPLITVEAPPEEEVAFALPGVVVAPAIPDIDTITPPEVVLESDESFVTADGKLIRYQFNWQNPRLLHTIYPFRNEKLRDFLLYFTEIDLVNDFNNRGIADPAIQAKIAESKDAIQARRTEVLQKLGNALAARQAVDKAFAGISGTDQAKRFKQKYYIDYQLIQRANDRLDDLTDQREAFIKRIAWWPDDPAKTDAERAHAKEQRERWQNEARKLDPDIAQLKRVIAQLKNFRQLFDEADDLPGADVTIQDVLRWQVQQKKEQWSALDQNQLLKEIITWINREPDRFPEWLIYMVIHFSGMRYMSAHSSFAEPRFLLESLKRDDLQEKVKKLDLNGVIQECQQAISRLLKKAVMEPALKPLVDRLTPPDRGALLDVCMSEITEDLNALKDDDACLAALDQYRQDRDAEAIAANDPKRGMPPWVWAEICKFTPLRLQTNDPNWEAYSPERSKWQNHHWREVLASWEQKDVTAWRSEHAETLSLIVTRAVCNEIAEHIQDLRGLAPVGGLAARPKWYMRAVADDPKRAYLKQAPAERDFRPGASILFLEWVDRQPNPWQIASTLTGFTLPGQIAAAQPEKKGEEKKQVPADPHQQSNDGWKVIPVGNTLTRERDIISDDPKKPGKVIGSEKQWLRWRHEATVVGVFDMIDGPYVMTFETGPIGLELRSLYSLVGNQKIFVGYIPQKPLPPPADPNDKPTLDDRLVNMLRWDRILPGAGLPPRTRPLFVEDPIPADDAQTGTVIDPTIPRRSMLVIRENVRTYTFTNSDNQNLPKMQGASPMVWLKAGMQVEVAAAYTQGLSGPGMGIVKASGAPEFFQENLYVLIADCKAEADAKGLYVKLNEVADLSKSRNVVAVPQGKSVINIQRVKFRNNAFIPVMELQKEGERVLLPPGAVLTVSTVHRDSLKDSGDGVIIADGGFKFYLILACQQVPAAAGFYVPVDLTKEV